MQPREQDERSKRALRLRCERRLAYQPVTSGDTSQHSLNANRSKSQKEQNVRSLFGSQQDRKVELRDPN